MEDLAAIRAAMQRLGVTQTAIADHLGIHKGDVSKLLSGKLRMRLETFRKIEAFLQEPERKAAPTPGVAEQRVAFERAPVRFVTLEEARKIAPAPLLSPEESERWRKDILALGEAAKRLPRITGMSDDEILGYDEME